VAEQNLEPDASRLPIDHPAVEHVFEAFEQGRYVAPRRWN
jgi:heat shock protein HspQ